MMRLAISTLLMVFLASCVDNSIPEYPENLVPEDTFVKVLSEVYLIEAVNNHQISIDEMEEGQVYTYYADVFARYEVDSALFFESLEWYKKHPRALSAVYDKALQILQEKRDEI